MAAETPFNILKFTDACLPELSDILRLLFLFGGKGWSIELCMGYARACSLSCQ